MITQGDNIRRQIIHDFHGRYALVLRINQRALQHITGNYIQHIFLFPPHLVHITGEQRQSPDKVAGTGFHLC